MGNALRTISMRIRGYDETTEEYSEDVAALTGAVADLTRVASNNNRGISLFEDDDPERYRSTCDILRDIADIWDELTDKNQAQLLEVLFGKQRAQTGAAILGNFGSVESALEKMQNSAGNAMQEMEKVYDSIEYRLNQLGETWVGVAQNLINTDQFKIVVSILTKLSELVDGLTSALGLFGTAAVAAFGVQLVKSVGRPKFEGPQTVPTYAPAATRTSFAA